MTPNSTLQGGVGVGGGTFFCFIFFCSTRMTKPALNEQLLDLLPVDHYVDSGNKQTGVFQASERHQQERPHSTSTITWRTGKTSRHNGFELKEPNVPHPTDCWLTHSHFSVRKFAACRSHLNPLITRCGGPPPARSSLVTTTALEPRCHFLEKRRASALVQRALRSAPLRILSQKAERTCKACINCQGDRCVPA